MKIRDMLPWTRRAAGHDMTMVNAAGTSVTIANLNPDQIREFLQHGGMSDAGVAVNNEVALSQAVYYRCIHLLTATMASLPIDLMERDAKGNVREVDDSAKSVLTRRANQWQSAYEFKRMMEFHRHTRGFAVAYKVRSPSNPNRVLSLIPMHPDRVQVKQNADLTLRFEYRTQNGSARTYQQDDVLYVPGLSFDGVHSMSTIQYARNAFGIAVQAEKSGGKMFTQGTLTGWGLKHPGKLSEAAKSNIQQSVFGDGGVVDSNLPPVFEEGMEPVTLGMTAEDLEFLATRKFQRSEIAMFCGVPLFLLGDTEKVTSWGSGIEQQMIGFVQFTLQEHISAWEGAATRSFDTPENRFWKWRTEGLLRGDFKARVDGYHMALQDGWLNPNEVRELEDRNPYEGGDVYRVPSNTEPNMAGADQSGANDNGNGGASQ